MTVDLTKKGLREYERVLDAVFKYAQILQKEGPKNYIYEETKKLGDIRFRFMSKGSPINTCSSFANKM